MAGTRANSLGTTWFGWYLITFVLLVVTDPHTSHSDSWNGVPFSCCVMLFGSYRLSVAGARPGTCFVYGCGSAILFLYRFFGMDRFSLWLEYQASSTEVIVFQWIALALVLGAICGSIGMLRSANSEAQTDSD